MVNTLYNSQKKTSLRRKLRLEMPKGEKLLWFKLRNSQMGWKFRRQFGIGDYIVDFYCSELKFAIEVDGFSHQNFQNNSKDITRDRDLSSLGITIKRYTSEQIFCDLDAVCLNIIHCCKTLALRESQSRPPHPASPWKGEE